MIVIYNVMFYVNLEFSWISSPQNVGWVVLSF